MTTPTSQDSDFRAASRRLAAVLVEAMAESNMGPEDIGPKINCRPKVIRKVMDDLMDGKDMRISTVVLITSAMGFKINFHLGALDTFHLLQGIRQGELSADEARAKEGLEPMVEPQAGTDP